MSAVVQGSYLIAALLLITGVMRLRTPARARSGNALAALGVAIALAGTFVAGRFPVPLLVGGIGLGGLIGAVSARRVRITAMPQMVAAFNGVGGGAAALVAMGDVLAHRGLAGAPIAVALLTMFIGGVSFGGSVLAFLKLQELVSGRRLLLPAHQLWNGLLLLLTVALGLVAGLGRSGAALALLAVAAVALGIVGVLPVGGADMPVVISLLNAFTGLAAAATGFLLGNNALIMAGTLVGASGTILTQEMSRAMHRNLASVLFPAAGGRRGTDGVEATGVVRSTTPEEVAMLLAYAGQVIVVPGFGLAVARAQKEVRELAERLEARGITVKYAIHPVAGRMPGHMNVLLAEADVPYEQLYEMEAINPEFARTDVALVVGANDVTNPAAREDPGSPLYGMPILNVDQARTVVVLKRSLAPGFAGVENPLYTKPNTLMLFGDAKASLTRLATALSEL